MRPYSWPLPLHHLKIWCRPDGTKEGIATEATVPILCVPLPQVCPLLLRVFIRRGGHHRLEEFARRGQEPDGEVTMYTWPDATLRELSDLVKEVRAKSLGPNAASPLI